MAGASMKDIKLRIRSVESTMQITKAMQLVASSKLRRAREHMERSRPYARVSREAVMAAVASCRGTQVPYVAQRPVQRRCYVVIAGDRGLAGGYNNNVFKAVAAHRSEAEAEAQGSQAGDYVLPLGRKAVDYYHRAPMTVLSEAYTRVEGLSVGACYRAAQLLLEGYDRGNYDEIVLVYTDLVNMMTQEVCVERLVPIDHPTQADDRHVSTVYEPEPEELLRRVMPDFLSGRLYSAVCDSYASEVASRRNAMDSATKNADAMISDLRLRYNRARQGAITQEITEIVAGAEK